MRDDSRGKRPLLLSSLLVFAVAALDCLPVAAQQLANEPMPVEVVAHDRAALELERSFWRCDHATTHGMIDPGSAAVCSSAMEELKAGKFSGDFGALLAWWQEHKAARHLELTAAANRESR